MNQLSDITKDVYQLPEFTVIAKKPILTNKQKIALIAGSVFLLFLLENK